MAGRDSHRKVAGFNKKKERKIVYPKLKCTDINIKQGFILGGKWDYWKPWVTSKTPVPARAAYSAILSLSIGMYVYLIISVPIFALPYILIIMYVYWLNIPSKKEIYAALLDIILHLIRMHFDIRQTNSKGKTKKKLILLKPYSRFLTDC